MRELIFLLNSIETCMAIQSAQTELPTDAQLAMLMGSLGLTHTTPVLNAFQYDRADPQYALTGRVANCAAIPLGSTVTLQPYSSKQHCYFKPAYCAESIDQRPAISDILYREHQLPRVLGQLITAYLPAAVDWSNIALPAHVQTIFKTHTLEGAVATLRSEQGVRSRENPHCPGPKFALSASIYTREYRVVRLISAENPTQAWPAAANLKQVQSRYVDYGHRPSYRLLPPERSLTSFSFTCDPSNSRPTVTAQSIEHQATIFPSADLEHTDWNGYCERNQLPIMRDAWLDTMQAARPHLARRALFEPDAAIQEIIRRQVTSACIVGKKTAEDAPEAVCNEESALTHLFELPVDVSHAHELPGNNEREKIGEWIRRIELVLNRLLCDCP